MRIGRLGIVITVMMDDGSVLSTPDDDRPIDRILFERRFRESWPPLSEDDEPGISEEHILYMAWVQLHRQELAAGEARAEDFDGWLAGVMSVEMETRPPEEDPAGPPTDATASTGA